MGSHYIRVGNLKIDKAILDLVCPAAGYDSTPPPPEIYCPANNYYIPSEPVFPDDGAPEVTPPVQGGDDEIIFIVSNHIPIEFKWNLNRSSGNLKWKIYGDNDVLLDSGTQAAGQFAYHFYKLDNGYPAGDGAMFFKVHFTCVTNGAYFTFCTTGATTSVIPVIKAWLNAPQLTNFDFRFSQLLTELWCCDEMNEVVGPMNMQNTISLKKLRLPASALSLITCDNMLLRSSIEDVVFPKTTNIETMKSALSYSKVRKVTFPDTISQSASDIYLESIVSYCDYLEEISFPHFTSQPIRLNNALANCPRLKKIKFHPNLIIKEVNGILANSPLASFENDDFVINNSDSLIFRTTILSNNFKVKKITLLNDLDNYTITTWLGPVGTTNNCVIETIEYPDKVKATRTSSYVMTSLKNVIMPKEVTDLVSDVNFPYINQPNLEMLTKVDNFNGAIFTYTLTCPVNLKIFNQPDAIFSHSGTSTSSGIRCSGTLAAPRSLEYFDIKWNESVAAGLAAVNLAYNNLSKTEIERIFTALPAVAGTYYIRVNNNPGSVAADGTIASNKGWTVTK